MNTRGVPLIIPGLACLITALLWHWLGKPTPTAVRMAELLGHATPEAPTVGPIILAAAGAFLILLGVILHAAPDAQGAPRH